MPDESLTPELLAGLLADGDDELAAWVLREAMTDRSRVDVYEDLLAGAMHLVGERWASGLWSVAEEHLASQTLLRVLDRIRPDLGSDARIGPLAVLAGVAGEHHMIALVCLDHVLRERGWTVANLGADVPPADLARFVERNEARLVALTASVPRRAEAATSAVKAVRTGAAANTPGRQVPILLGGGLSQEPGIGESLGVDWHGASLTDATRYADGVLAALSTADA